MTNEDALDKLNQSCDECLMVNDCIEEECLGFVCKKALEKQIPKKPIKYISDRADKPYESFLCPMCQSREELYEGQPYCSECSQAIDWSEEE